MVLSVWPYIPFFGFLITNENCLGIFFNGYSISTVIVCLMNIIYACRSKGEDSFYQLAYWNMLIKLAHIPFYLFTVAAGVLLLIAMVVPAFILLSPVIVFGLMLADLFLMVTTSLYGVNAIIRARQNKIVSRKFCVINTLLHFVFVLDVISSVCIFVRLRKYKTAFQFNK